MVMAKKDTIKKPSTRSFAARYGAMILIGFLVLAVGGVYGYNKYLDRQNVSDMKQLLADFEQLEKDIESETGEELYIEATCGSVGKFATSYSCDVTLAGKGSSLSEGVTANFLLYISKQKNCEILSTGLGGYKGALNCVVHVRESNENNAENVFINYDTSPGSAI
jgi:hypothetical protein